MRRPFILFLIMISLYCWLVDLTNFFFYLFHINSSAKGIYSALISLFILLAAVYYAKTVVLRHSSLSKAVSLFQTDRKREWLLLLLVSLPVIMLGLYRCIYPDENWDTLHYELYLQEFDLKDNNVNFAAGALRTYFFPLSERICAVWRHLLGYRLGTIFNTFLLVTILISVYDFLKKLFSLFAPDRRFPAILVALLSLFAIFSDYTLFTISTYKTDLIGVPLILELLHRFFFNEKSNRKSIDHFVFFLLASLTMAYKLTYAPYVGSLALLYVIKNLKGYSPAKRPLFFLIIPVFPAIYLLYNLIQTGNPVFPLYNKLFHSPLYPYENFKDLRFGLKKNYELFIYPFVTYLDNNRLDEFALYSYRLLFGYIISLTGIVLFIWQARKKKDEAITKWIFYLSLLAVFFDYACIVTTGIYRYGSIIEILYGIIICLWILYLQERRITTVFFVFILFFQSYRTYSNFYVKKFNLSWHDYNDLSFNQVKLRNNIGRMLNDRSGIEDPGNILPKIDGFVSMNPLPMDGLAKLLKRDAPIYDIYAGTRTQDSIDRFEKNLRAQSENKTFVVAADVGNLGETMMALNSRGYLATGLHEVYPSFLRYNEPLFLIQVKYMDTAKYTIKYTEQNLREENAPPSRRDFTYRSPHLLKAYIREAPFAFDWNFLEKNYGISLNGQQLSTNDGFKNNKIFTITGNDLSIHKSTNVPYLILIQEIIEKP